MRRGTRTSVGVAAALAAAALGMALLPGMVRAQTPLYFPRTQSLDSSAYTLRVAGSDRYATAGALARVAADNQRVDTGFPFNEPDATTPTKAYGFATCPRTVGIAAGDSVADALSASSVKDLGLLTIGNPPKQVDTTGISLLLTVSARQGGFQADVAKETLDTLSDLRASCGNFDIVVFGGETAVPAPAFRALEALGNNTVRVVGADRFDTASKVAQAVSGVRGPANVDIFTAAETKTSFPNAVFLAEGFTGADALAVGPYLANKNVPILLTETAKLPEATRNALLALRPQNIIVLGGPAAVSDATAIEAKRAAGIPAPPQGQSETITRISGPDRYQTSIAIAQQLFDVRQRTPGTLDPVLGGPPPVDFSNQLVSIARSEGSGANHVGFADALSSAFFLDSAADSAVAPIRLAPPIEGNVQAQAQDGSFGPKVTIGGTKGPRRAPLYLVPRNEVPAPTLTHLGTIFPNNCCRQSTPAAAAARANNGGFGFVFGGDAAVARATELRLAQRISGETYTPGATEGSPGNRSDLVPSMTPGNIFFTNLSYEGYSTPLGGGINVQNDLAEGPKVCALRDALKGTQWLASYEAGSFRTAEDVDYQGPGQGFPVRQSRPFCGSVEEVASLRAQVLGFSLSGHETAPISIDGSGSGLKIDPPASDDRSDSVTSGSNLTTERTCSEPTGLLCLPSGGGKSTVNFSGTTDIDYQGTSYSDAPFTLTLNFNRQETSTGGSNDDYITFDGTFSVRESGSLLFNASLSGEATGRQSPFKLVGMYTTGAGKGGMRATVTVPAADNFVLTDFVLDGPA
jgi:hypothetical protein